MKKLRQSKTFWLNLLIVIVGAIGGVMNTDVIVNNPALVGYLAAATGVLNIILRIFSPTAIKGI